MQTNIKIGKEKITVKENLLERAIRTLAPSWGFKRFQARSMMALAGGYIGASYSNRSTSQWATRGSDPDSAILFDLPTLRNRSRDMLRNTPIALGAINTNCTNIVGTGLILQSRIDREVLNISDEEASSWESNTEREFRLWAESQECDAARTLTFVSIQELALRSCLENGDVFVLMPYINRKGSPYKLKLQLIEADRICNKGHAANTQTLSGGVERDDNGAPIAYHILDQHPGSIYGAHTWTWKVIPAFGAKTGRRNVIHLFRTLRPGQNRGVPYLAPVIEMLKQLGRYTDAELMAAVISGMFTVFIKTEQGDGDLALMTPASEAGQDAASKASGDYKLSSGAIVGLGKGESIEVADPKRPNVAFDPFVMAILRQVGVALEIPFEILIKHFTSSYSAARAALLDAWKYFSSRRDWLAMNFCQMVYEAWLDEAISTGRIDAPGFFDDPLIRKAYCGSEWPGPAKGMIDEKAEVQAAQLRIEAGITTLTEETAAMTGGDWLKKHPQTVKEHNMRKAAGLIPEAKIAKEVIQPDSMPAQRGD